MSDQRIGQGPGNLVPDSDTKEFLAGEAIAIGELVALSTAATGTARGYTVVLADSGAAATTIVVGVASAAVADGDWGTFYTGGYVPMVKTDGSVSLGDWLVAHTVDGEVSTMADGEEEQVIGMATAADGDGTLDADQACIIFFKRV